MKNRILYFLLLGFFELSAQTKIVINNNAITRDSITTVIRPTGSIVGQKMVTEKAVRDAIEAIGFGGNFVGSGTTLAALNAITPKQNKDIASLTVQDGANPPGIYMVNTLGNFELVKSIPDIGLLSTAQIIDQTNTVSGTITGQRFYEAWKKHYQDSIKKSTGAEIYAGLNTEYKIYTPQNLHLNIRDMIGTYALELYQPNFLSYTSTFNPGNRNMVIYDKAIYRAIATSIPINSTPSANSEYWEKIGDDEIKRGNVAPSGTPDSDLYLDTLSQTAYIGLKNNWVSLGAEQVNIPFSANQNINLTTLNLKRNQRLLAYHATGASGNLSFTFDNSFTKTVSVIGATGVTVGNVVTIPRVSKAIVFQNYLSPSSVSGQTIILVDTLKNTGINVSQTNIDDGFNTWALNANEGDVIQRLDNRKWFVSIGGGGFLPLVTNTMMWEPDYDYRTNQVFSFTTAATNAVDINGVALTANKMYLGRYTADRVSPDNITTPNAAEILLIEVIGDGGAGNTIQTLNASGNVTNWSSTVLVGATPLTGNITLTLPTVVGNIGEKINVVRLDNTTFTVSLVGQAGQTVTLANNATELGTQNGALEVQAVNTTSIRQLSDVRVNNATGVFNTYGVVGQLNLAYGSRLQLTGTNQNVTINTATSTPFNFQAGDKITITSVQNDNGNEFKTSTFICDGINTSTWGIVYPSANDHIILQWGGTFSNTVGIRTSGSGNIDIVDIIVERNGAYGFVVPTGTVLGVQRTITGTTNNVGYDNFPSIYQVTGLASDSRIVNLSINGTVSNANIINKEQGLIKLEPNGVDITVTYTTEVYLRQVTSSVNINGVSGSTGISVRSDGLTPIEVQLTVPSGDNMSDVTVTNATRNRFTPNGAVVFTPNNNGNIVLTPTFISQVKQPAGFFTAAGARGTFVSYGSIRVALTASGNANMMIRSASGTINITFSTNLSYTDQTSGSTALNTASTFSPNTTWNFTAAGSMQETYIHDTTNNRNYYVRMIITNAYNNILFYLQEL